MLENDKLTENVDRLEGSVAELEQVEQELAQIANTDNVDRLVYVVSENKKINEKMKVGRTALNGIYDNVYMSFHSFALTLSRSTLLDKFK